MNQVRTRTPLRLGLAGGGTDLASYCDAYGGAVLNCTIDRYAYAFVSPRDDDLVVFQARDIGRSETHPAGVSLDMAGGLRLHRCAYNHFVQNRPSTVGSALTLTTVVDAPAGSGLGASSALVVAMCEALSAHMHQPLALYDLAQLAFDIERGRLGLAGGKQDQYSATFGGINFIEFLAGDRVIVNPLRVADAIVNELEASLVVCFVGEARVSSDIIALQVENIRSGHVTALDGLHALKAAAFDMKDALLRGDLPRVALILGESWQAKKRTAASVSNAVIDTLFEVGLAAGAMAGKISGAGGGGFMMFIVPPEDRQHVIQELNRAGGEASSVHLTSSGVETWLKPSLA